MDKKQLLIDFMSNKMIAHATLPALLVVTPINRLSLITVSHVKTAISTQFILMVPDTVTDNFL